MEDEASVADQAQSLDAAKPWKVRYDELVEELWTKVHDGLLARGTKTDEAAREADEAVAEVAQKQAAQYADALINGGVAHVAEVNAYRFDFAERLRIFWGDALDLYTVVVEVADGLAHDVLMRSREPGTRELDPLMGVMAALQGQTLRGSREVYALLSAGFPFGSLAASRTLYETAVRATILSDQARLPGNEDLISRYVDHGKIGWLKHAKIYARDAEQLGLPPMEGAFLERRAVEVEALKEAHPKAYRDTYGWAYGLPGITSTRDFSQLEALARTGHRRGYYLWTSHLVHADSLALSLSAVERGGAHATVSNASNRELAEPAAQAMWALTVVTEAVVQASVDVSHADVLTVRALVELVRRANQAFVDAEDRVHAAEVDLQAELAAEGKRITPWGVMDLPVPGAGPDALPDPEPDC